MNAEGFKKLMDAITAQPGLGFVKARPIPTDNQNKRFVSIDASTALSPAQVLNALDDAGLMVRDDDEQARFRRSLLFRVVAIDSAVITLQDTLEPTTRRRR